MLSKDDGLLDTFILEIMRSSNEMYKRGVADAEQDDLNLFYYQHYYYYRKGYDRARRRVQRTARSTLLSDQRVLLVAAGTLVVAVLVVAGLYWQPGPSTPGGESGSVAVSSTSTAETSTATSTPRPTSTPSPSPTPTPQTGLRPGATAQVVNVGDAALLARQGPSTDQPVQARLPEGASVVIIDGPREAEGYTWWLIDSANGGGWSAEESLEGVVWLQPE
jgi:hypothetical protein